MMPERDVFLPCILDIPGFGEHAAEAGSLVPDGEEQVDVAESMRTMARIAMARIAISFCECLAFPLSC